MGDAYAPLNVEEQDIPAKALDAHVCREATSDPLFAPSAPTALTPREYLARLWCFAVYMEGAAMMPYGYQVIKHWR